MSYNPGTTNEKDFQKKEKHNANLKLLEKAKKIKHKVVYIKNGIKRVLKLNK